MVICRKCNHLYDPGDLMGGVCDDCREEEMQTEIRRERNRTMLERILSEQPDSQLVLCSR